MVEVAGGCGRRSCASREQSRADEECSIVSREQVSHRRIVCSIGRTARERHNAARGDVGTVFVPVGRVTVPVRYWIGAKRCGRGREWVVC